MACDTSCTVSLSCAFSSLNPCQKRKDPAGSNRNPEHMDSVHGREEFGAHMEPKRRELPTYVRQPKLHNAVQRDYYWIAGLNPSKPTESWEPEK